LSAEAGLLAFGVFAAPVSASAAPPAKPGIVFIMADDLGIGDVHCYNPDSKIPTPNMDALAKEGAMFTDAHTPASVCTPSRYSVLTYNIHHAAGMDGKVDLERIAKVIRSANPDIVALQEVDKVVPRSGKADEAAKLAELTGMNVVFSKSISLGGGAYGNALLSRLPVLGHEVLPLPGHEARSALVAKLRMDKSDPKSEITFFATHFPLQEARRVKCAEKISAYLKEHKIGAALLAGDLNARPESPPIKVLEKDWTNASAGKEWLTMPADKPTSQIDYVLFRPADGWKVLETRVLDEKVASDHRPFLVVLGRK
jgi:endonuclease/exonuclease/phosphatase family metal-dependent hydrolase